MINHSNICLNSYSKISDTVLKCWIECCFENCPSGVITGVEVPPTNQNLQFYKRNLDGQEICVTALSRDLTADEAGKVAKSFAKKQENGNYEITWSQSFQDDKTAQKLSEDLLKAITLEAARMNHNRWVQMRMDEGWRYGQNHSNRGKISPICRSWDQLPDQYKRAEYTRIKTLLEVLDNMNLQLARK